MSSEVVIETTGLCKFYNVYQHPADRLKQMIVRGRKRYYTPVEAVKDVDVQIRRGETFGIVGRNGSGKSTFLQMVCGTVAPSMGELEVSGKVSALLELGAGFSPEFTGRENVYVSGSVMGLSDEEMDHRFQDIIDFADIGNFIDQPVKNYSSGMFARLAFAVAINVDADILVVDEALSVGDEAFQRKCFARIQQMNDAGCTILFVSHAAGTVVELCDRAMLMDRGERLMVGSPKTVVEAYQRLIFARPEDSETVRQEILEDRLPEVSAEPDEQPQDLPYELVSTGSRFDPGMVPESTVSYAERGCAISDVAVYDRAGSMVNTLLMGESYEYRYRVTFTEPCRRVRFGMMIKRLNGTEVGGLVSHPDGEGIDSLDPGHVVEVRFRFVARLASGSYFANAGVVGDVHGEEVYLHRILDAAMFRVEGVARNRITGPVDLSSEGLCDVERVV